MTEPGFKVHRERRERPSTPTAWTSVVLAGIVAATTLGCGWGLVYYLLNR